jgi:molybdate transport system substrate-binding protein
MKHKASPPKLVLPLVALLAILLLAVACGGDDDSSPTPTPGSSPSDTGPTPTRTPVNASIIADVKVFAASSLTEVFTQIGDDFEATAPGIAVSFQFGGSQELRTQLEQGASADVFASADRDQLEIASNEGLLSGLRQVFARNRLVIIVPKANEANIATPQDLAKDGLKIIIGGEAVPVGKYARRFLQDASASSEFQPDYGDRVLANVVSEATNVKEIVSAVTLGEVDAGIVYATDVSDENSDQVSKIDIPESVNPIVEYPISLTYSGAGNQAAQLFLDYVNGEEGQATLAAFGFAPGDRR